MLKGLRGLPEDMHKLFDPGHVARLVADAEAQIQELCASAQ